jgi:hypothetical protein
MGNPIINMTNAMAFKYDRNPQDFEITKFYNLLFHYNNLDKNPTQLMTTMTEIPNMKDIFETKYD